MRPRPGQRQRRTTGTLAIGLAAWAGLFAVACASESDQDAPEQDDGGTTDDGAEDGGDDPGDEGQAAVDALRAEESFAMLDAPQQDALERLVEQPLNVLSKAARIELTRLIESADYQALSLAEQAEMLWGLTRLPQDYANPNPDGTFQGVLPKLAQLVAAIAPEDSEVELGEPVISTRVGAPPPLDEEVMLQKLALLLDPSARPGPDDLIGAEDFEDAPEECAEFPLLVNGEEFLVTAPLVDGAPPDPAVRPEPPADEEGVPLMVHSVEDTATAMGRLPAANRALLEQIDLHERRNPMDAVYAVLYQRDDFRAYMSALIYPIGVAGVFPQAGEVAEIDYNTLAHESGHVWTFQQWSLDTSTEGWREWIAAMQSDLLAVSTYADSSFLEDSAEMVLLISAVRSMGAEGEALAEEFRALFPARWEILERDFPL
jgi:hypothetical protein